MACSRYDSRGGKWRAVIDIYVLSVVVVVVTGDLALLFILLVFGGLMRD